MKDSDTSGVARGFLAVLLALLVNTASGESPPSIETFAAYSDFGAVTLSSDGKRIAYTTHSGGKRALVVLDLEQRTLKPILAAEVDNFQITWCAFKSAQRLLCGLRGYEFFGPSPVPVTRLIAINADGTKLKTLIQNGASGTSRYQDRILDWLHDDPSRVLIQLSPRDSFSQVPEVWSIDVESGVLERQLKQRLPIRAWYSDSNGVVRYGQGCEEDRRCEYVTRDSADAPWRVLKRWQRFEDDSWFSVLGFAPGGDKLLVTEMLDDRLAVYQLDLADQQDKELVFAHPQFDVGGAIEWPRSNRLVGFWYESDRYRREFFDAEAAATYAVVDKSLPGTINTIVDTARDGKLLLIAAHSDVLPREHYLLDLETRSLSKVAAIAPELARVPLAPMKPVKITTPDGTLLPGYLTVPAGAEAKNLPLVVYPHGGPHARDSWGFDDVVQFMASRGYAVLQVNFRGSIGYGKAWFEAGLRKWGTVMVDDVNVAARWAVSQGIADPKRVCIAGRHFGGYAALMGVIRDPDLYRCAVSIGGVTSLRDLRWGTRTYYGGFKGADYFFGSDSDELAAGSPLKGVHKIQVPVLLVHGGLDSLVSDEHSTRMYRAMGGFRKQRELREFVHIKDGDHALSRYEWRVTLFTKLEEFLSGALAPQRKTPP